MSKLRNQPKIFTKNATQQPRQQLNRRNRTSLAKELVGQGVKSLDLGSPSANDDAAGGEVVGTLERLRSDGEAERQASGDDAGIGKERRQGRANAVHGACSKRKYTNAKRKRLGGSLCCLPPTSWGPSSLPESSCRCICNEQGGLQEMWICKKHEGEIKGIQYMKMDVKRASASPDAQLRLLTHHHVAEDSLLDVLQANVKTLSDETISDLLVDNNTDGTGGDVPNAASAAVIELVGHA